MLLTLRDNGPGFSAEALQRAREPFFTTKSTRGLGLGLAICDTLTRAPGGELRMSNHAEGGAQLGLFLRSAEPGVAFPPRTISMSSDTPISTQAGGADRRRSASAPGTEPDPRPPGSRWQPGRRPRPGRTPADGLAGAVVSDIRMPGIDGLELLQQLRARDSELPVIFITGHGDIQLAVQAMRAGAYDFSKALPQRGAA